MNVNVLFGGKVNDMKVLATCGKMLLPFLVVIVGNS